MHSAINTLIPQQLWLLQSDKNCAFKNRMLKNTINVLPTKSMIACRTDKEIKLKE